VLHDAGLVAAIDSRLARLPVTVGLHVDGAADRRWPAPVEGAAYFVVVEAVTNALKHAPGSTVHVRIGAGAGRLCVEVADDGPGGAGTADWRGLRGLQDRVESLEGTFAVGPSPGGGTVVRADFPAVAVAR
jgi:signal transduction histidine kinase